MDDPISFDSMDVSLSTNFQENFEKPRPDTPFRILIMGDFSGRANRGVETDGSDIGQRMLFKVDRDSDEKVMEKMAVSIRLRVAGNGTPPVDMTFGELDDFHPEQIYFRTDIFKKMKDVRNQLINPDTFVETASRLTGKSMSPTHPRHDKKSDKLPPGEPCFAGDTTGNLLDHVLDASLPAAVGGDRAKPQTDWDRFLGDIVGPHLVPDIEKEQDAMVEAVDRTISDLMRRLIHHPDFQAIESAWRALQFCLRRLETDENLMVYLIDVSKVELASDLTAHEDLRDTASYKILASTSQHHRGQAPWSLLAGMYTFSPKKMDAVVLARLGAMGQMFGAPFVSRGDTGFMGCPSLPTTPDPSDWTVEPEPSDKKAWQAVRTLPEARWIGLALPRFLIRMPYGEATDPVDAFAFEEIGDPADHEHYLWANPIFALILVLGRTFTQFGWEWSRGLASGVSGLPLHVFEEQGERTLKPCAEVFLSDRSLEKIIGYGLMPLVSFKDQDRIQLARFQSVADPLSPLSGRWYGSSLPAGSGC
ncbi:type VI secretion system contractile sheath domain-containing protein [uncultured Desulfosarcina sp.]|uniref:type VI secretion system contractile sheath domain-containing protein n=1 Tax=uncultured Desulfosarcina sp. TaxID=218289 RepID=UPI0029C839CD|nr:type VI secretion system contractile sheath large subunit [uncultured Desulfosarcina sp.]